MNSQTTDWIIIVMIVPFLPAAAIGWAIGTTIGVIVRRFDKEPQ